MRDDTLAKVLFAALNAHYLRSHGGYFESVAWDDEGDITEEGRDLCRAGADAVEAAIKAQVAA